MCRGDGNIKLVESTNFLNSDYSDISFTDTIIAVLICILIFTNKYANNIKDLRLIKIF